ncbi:MAG TPA: TIM barrel protein, partial [Candidatus Sulfotelmatobacter sp.]|nr:TIM barrel protein [Candidatus Sulfotelmatobacter sp.]
KVAADCGVVLALQNHGPDIVNNYRDVLALIREVGSPAFKACMDINIDEQPESAEHAREMVKATGKLLVHSHLNGEFRQAADGSVVLAAAGYFDQGFWGRKVAYPAYVEALVAAGYEGYLDWEFCHPAMENGKPAGIDYVHEQTRLALEYMRTIRAAAEAKLGRPPGQGMTGPGIGALPSSQVVG